MTGEKQIIINEILEYARTLTVEELRKLIEEIDALPDEEADNGD